MNLEAAVEATVGAPVAALPAAMNVQQAPRSARRRMRAPSSHASWATTAAFAGQPQPPAPATIRVTLEPVLRRALLTGWRTTRTGHRPTPPTTARAALPRASSTSLTTTCNLLGRRLVVR